MPGTYISPAETGLYYLLSRYYDPNTGRFINADGIVATGQGMLGNNMFTYCGNNPVMFVDSTGCLPVSVLGIVDFYFIHKKVQDDIKSKKGWETEVYVNGDLGSGRLDLYDEKTNSYYEVKSRGAAYTFVKKDIRASTRKQMRKYDVATINDRRFPDLTEVSPSRGLTQVSGHVEYGIWDAKYSWERPGLIVYDITLNVERAAKAALVVGGVVGLAAATGGASLPYTVPATVMIGG